ncbi:MAG: hypothetical protein M3O33_23185 [Cyanobacteriota bacterium]|nr:hypothetical protein [Cyanobacteriota bacterium]
MGLIDGLDDPKKTAKLVADCVNLIDEQVSAKSGLSGLGLKAAYAAVNGIKPNYIAGAIEALLPETLVALDPIWSEGIQTGTPAEYLIQNRSRAADSVLSITDARIETSQRALVRSSYKKLRKSVKNDVEEAIPGLARIIDNYTKG